MASLVSAHTDKEITTCRNSTTLREWYQELVNCYESIVKGELLYCAKCDSWKPSSQFYKSKDYKNGKFPVCKDCLNKMAQQIDSEHDEPNETEESIKRTLQFMNLPFHPELYYVKVQQHEGKLTKAPSKYDKSKPKGFQIQSPFQAYVSEILRSKQYATETWYDGDKDAVFKLDSDIDKIKEETVKRFGNNYSSEDLLFLQNEYDDWIHRYECNTKAQEECFQRLCSKKLEISKALKQGKPTKDLEATYKTWMDSANVTPRQNGADTLSQSQTFGTLIQKFEMERPIPEPDPELQDVDRIVELSEIILGHTCKAAGIKTGYNELYEKFMRDYTVEKVEDEETEQVESELYNELFGDSSV